MANIEITKTRRRCDRCGGHVAETVDRLCITECGPRPLCVMLEGVVVTFSDLSADMSADLCKSCTLSLRKWWLRPQGAP